MSITMQFFVDSMIDGSNIAELNARNLYVLTCNIWQMPLPDYNMTRI